MDNNNIQVEISNITTRTVSVPEKAVICEIQPVTIAQNSNQTHQEEIMQHITKINIEQDNLSREEVQQGQNLIHEYSDIFSTGDADVGHATSVQHRIYV